MKTFARLPVAVKAVLLIVPLVAGGLAVNAFSEQGRYDSAISDESKAHNAPTEPIQIAEKSKIAVTRTDIVITEEEVPFVTTVTYDGTLPKDTTVVRVEGQNGKKVIKTEVKTKDGVEVSRSLISEDITVPPVAKIIAVGTKVSSNPLESKRRADCNPNYQPCVPNVRRDLDCDDIKYMVMIIGEDVHNFDEEDNDGIGCERYGIQPPDLSER